ncbi:MAG: ABC transporter substrate-binding protein [Ruminococcus sp.]|uniref:ABC transporter substrate-binding protein n=1 Tax=Ruminococcus sp. TaxID=41978 RepID=UPI002873715D|nr:ABC transporter substrate-binding protein [Ruminococcus sp.]MBQ3286056.1 ABC transporter substrate-binding protein [Ruminococcus sp.]
MKKRVLAILLVLVLALTVVLTACGGSGSGDGGSSSGGKVAITIFNSKMEIQSQMEEMATKYSADKGVDVEVYYSSDTVAAHLSTRYASNDPYTISMVDAKDVYSLAADHAVDLSDQDWVKDTTQAIAIDGKTYGFPVCVEARGIIYNADAVKKATGEDFDPASVKTIDDFKALAEKTGTGVMKEDWSLAAHYLAEVYEQHDDPDAFIAGIKDGSIKLADDEKFNALMDTFDVLKANNYAKDSAISAEREVTEQKLAEGEIGFMFGGNWDWSVINAYEYSENMGIIPVVNSVDDGSSEKLVGGGSKYFFIDSSDNTTDDQRQAAKDFLNWLVYDEEGQDFIVNKCALVPAYSNITLDVQDPLGASVKKFADAGALIPNYNYLPDDHYAKCGAIFQKYLADEIDRAAFAQEITDYWSTAEVGEH